MVEIVAGNTQFTQLPDNHIIKAFCRQYKITKYDTQEALMRLINECFCLYFNELTSTPESKPVEQIVNEEITKRAEEL